jgi:hypothetical protein
MNNLNNRPEIKAYPVQEIKVYPMEFYPNRDWGHSRGNQTTNPSRWLERNGRSPDEDRYLRGLIGKSVTVHTVSAGRLQGILAALLADAIILRTARGQLLIHDWAIAAVQSE